MKINKLAIVGMGYVGIPLSVHVTESGIRCIGLDIDENRVKQLNKGKSPLSHIPDEKIKHLLEQSFEITSDYKKIEECDAIIICVPTPLTSNREPDLTYVTSTVRQILPYLQKNQVIVLESTTWPGTTNEVIAPMVKKAGFVPGDNIHLVYSPEREDPGNGVFNTKTIPKVVGADFKTSLEIGVKLYEKFIDNVIPVNSTRAAEMVKLVENIHRSVNIGLVNELKILTDRMKIDIFDVIDAAATKPFGFTKYLPGPGVGGHCIPIDPFYLTWKAREFGLHTRFIELAGEINSSMPEYVIERLIKHLNTKGKALSKAKVLCMGIAYKADINDARESPSVMVMELLKKWNADISYHDPYFPHFPKMRDHQFELSHQELDPETLKTMDAVLILTNHKNIDYELIYDNASLIVDTRGVYREDPRKVVVRA